MKFELMPYQFSQLSTNNISIQRTWVATYPDTDSTVYPDDSEMIQSKDFQTYPAVKPKITRFYRLGKYLKGIDYDWLPVDAEVQNPQKLTTHIKMWGTNFNPG